jgi:ketosteroid isomerase-like protein
MRPRRRVEVALVSGHNVELHRRIYEAFNARDVDGLVALSDPSVAVQSVFAAVSGTVYHGHDGVRRWQGDLEEAWGEEIHVEAEAYFDLGTQTLAFDVMYGRGQQSGAEVALPGAAITRWRDGLCVSFKAFGDREEALRDLGVSEDALEPIAP